MEVLLIEDEAPAARRLRQLINELSPGLTIIGVLDSVEAAVTWFKTHTSPSLVFMDIHLADGLSFDILEQVSIHSPVVFTTAYDEYAIRAFELNSIDYLLKPIEKAALARSLKKYESLNSPPANTVAHPLLQDLLTTLHLREKTYKSRFLVSINDKLFTIAVEDIAYFTSEDKAVVLVTHTSRRYIIDFSLDKLESALDPRRFFRLNRQFIVQLPAIKKISQHFNGKLKVELEPRDDKELLVSREKTGAFKAWLDR